MKAPVTDAEYATPDIDIDIDGPVALPGSRLVSRYGNVVAWARTGRPPSVVVQGSGGPP